MKATSDPSEKTARTRYELIRRLQKEDNSEAWREFYGVYRNLVLSVALKSSLSPEDAEEVVQETFVSVSQKLGEFKADPAAGSFKSWLLQKARWLILNKIAQGNRNNHLRGGKPQSQYGDSTSGTSALERIPAPPPDAFGAAWEKEWRNSLVNLALEKLKPRVNPRHFQVFYLLVIKEQSPAQVCRALGVNRGRVYLVKHRLARLFKKLLKDLESNLS